MPRHRPRLTDLEGCLDFRCVLFHLACAVTGSRPEEPSQTVATSPGDDVYVEVGDRLTDDIVDRDEGPLRFERLDQRPSDTLSAGYKRFHEVLRQVEQCLNMLQRGDEDMSFEDRPVIEKRDHLVSAENNRRIDITTADLAEHVVSHRHEISAIERRLPESPPSAFLTANHIANCERSNISSNILTL